MTRSPSVAQVADAQPFIWWLFSGTPDQASCCQRMFPLLRSTHRTIRFLPFSNAAVKKMRSPQTTGDDCPTPGSAVFQTTDVAFQCVGKPVSLECPLRSGPCQPGQSSATTYVVTQPVKRSNVPNRAWNGSMNEPRSAWSDTMLNTKAEGGFRFVCRLRQGKRLLVVPLRTNAEK